MKVFIGDTVLLDVDCGIDVSSYTTYKINYKKPDGTVGCWTAAISATDNTHIEYETLTADFDQKGVWTIQAFAYTPLDFLHGEWDEIKVYEPIECP